MHLTNREQCSTDAVEDLNLNRNMNSEIQLIQRKFRKQYHILIEDRRITICRENLKEHSGSI